MYTNYMSLIPQTQAQGRPNTSYTGTIWLSNTGTLFLDNTAKTFVIDHPDDTSKYLVHGCLEGPEGGVPQGDEDVGRPLSHCQWVLGHLPPPELRRRGRRTRRRAVHDRRLVVHAACTLQDDRIGDVRQLAVEVSGAAPGKIVQSLEFRLAIPGRCQEDGKEKDRQMLCHRHKIKAGSRQASILFQPGQSVQFAPTTFGLE